MKGKQGGTLVVGMTAGKPDVLDPTLARTFSGREVFLTFCEKLYDLDWKANIVPQLAAAIPTVSKRRADGDHAAPTRASASTTGRRSTRPRS